MTFWQYLDNNKFVVALAFVALSIWAGWASFDQIQNFIIKLAHEYENIKCS